MTSSASSSHIAHHRVSDGVSQSLADHLTAVASLASENAAKVGLGLPGELLGLVHDLGKYSAAFQAYIKSANELLDQDMDEEYVDAKSLRGQIDHSTAGAQLIWRELSTQGHRERVIAQILALCVASHHSGLIDCLSSDSRSLGEDVFSRRMNKEFDRTHLDEAVEAADDDVRARAGRILADSRLVSSLVDVLGRIHSERTSLSIVQQQMGLLVRLLLSCLIDADRTDTARFERNEPTREASTRDWDELIGRFEKHLQALPTKLPIDELRRSISQQCLDASTRERGIYSLTVPTGGGKTLASLRFALHHARQHGLDRIVYVIPFTSIIDQNAEQVRRILEPPGSPFGSVVLEHHSNLTPSKDSWRTKILSENWDAPIVFTTNVQFLEALLGSGTRSVRRMHQLTKAVLVFDEAQALPVSCVHLFNNAIRFLSRTGGSSALMCTATQPLLGRVCEEKGTLPFSQNAELITDVADLFSRLRRVDIVNHRKPGGWNRGDIAILVEEEASRTGSCLLVVNTKEAARQLFLLCRKADATVYHLSTSMCPRHRKEVLSALRERLEMGQRVICVSTQLIEAGIDIDFGAVVRFAAGLDSIAQAAGRCNRHGRRARGTVHVINPEGEDLDRLDDIRIGRDAAERVMNDVARAPEKYGTDLLSPAAVNWYYENYFFQRRDRMDYPVSAKTIGHDDTLLGLLAANDLAVAEYRRLHGGREPQLGLRQSFATAASIFEAIDAPTRGIVVPHGEGSALIAEMHSTVDPSRQFELLKRAQEFSVNVFPWLADRLASKGLVQSVAHLPGVVTLLPGYYGNKFGLSDEPIEEMEALIG